MSKRKTTEEFKQEIYDLVNDEYAVLGEYVNAKTKIKLKHNKCNHKYEVTPNNFLNGKRCPKCFGVHKKTTKEFQEELNIKYGDSYKILSEYKKNSLKILVQHKCGYKWEVRPYHLLKLERCPKCNDVIRMNDFEFKELVSKMHNSEYEFLEKYTGMATKIKVKHNVCNNIYFVYPHHFIHHKSTCPICNESKGEQKIRHCLENNNIPFSSQYTFEDCKDINALPFDFAIFEDEENTQLKCLIEYDGEGHYKPIFGEKSYKNTIKHDQMKNEYCKRNNIKLIRIPYWEFDDIEKLNINKMFSFF